MLSILKVVFETSFERWHQRSTFAGQRAEMRTPRSQAQRSIGPATHVRAGFIAYLAGQRDRSTAEFARAKQLTLPAQFKTLWDGQSSRTPAFAKVLEDKAFVAAVLGAQ